ncbi:MAG: shikimate kinase [Planctomycetes bacterium]|nr:shikimate kinase [Planctomycetota bacterium]
MNIVLVGYRGTGKTAVAELLAGLFGLRAVHLDDEIERKAAKTIPEIVRDAGWPAFRDLEEAVVARFSGQDGLVIDCGGGVVEREANFEALRAAGPVIWLQASVDTIVKRIRDDVRRPPLTESKSFTDEVAEVLARRTPLYQRLSHFAIDTDSLSVAQVVNTIQRLLIATWDSLNSD